MEEKEKFNQSKYNYQWAQENYYRLTVLLPKNQKGKKSTRARNRANQATRCKATHARPDQSRSAAKRRTQPQTAKHTKKQNRHKCRRATPRTA